MSPPFPATRLAADSALLVVDIQERLFRVFPQDVRTRVATTTALLVETARRLGVPVFVTEQYPKGLGPTVPEVVEALGDLYRPLSKLHFSCPRDPGVREALRASGRTSMTLVGIETHICITTTAEDLLGAGYAVSIACDGVGSRREDLHGAGLAHLRALGCAVVPGETLAYRWLDAAGSEAFKAVSKLVK